MPKFLDNALDYLRTQRTSPKQTAGTGGTPVIGGYIQSAETNRDLVGGERYRRYGEILANTSIVAASVRFYLNLCSKAQWTVEPAKDSGAMGEEIAQKVEEMLHDMTTPWHRVIRRASMYKMYGYSWQEWTAKRREDGLIGFLDIEPRPQRTIERWDLDESSTVYGVVQRSPQTQRELYLSRGKALYVVDDSLDGSPEGLGLLRHLADPARRLDRYLQLEGYGYETDLRGIPVGRAPYAALDEMVRTDKITGTERMEILNTLEDFIEKHIKTPQLGIVLDSMTYESTDESSTPSAVPQWDIDLLKGGSTGQEAMAASIDRINREMARVIGTEHLLLGENGGGSLAMSRDKSSNFALIIASTLQEIGETADNDIVKTLMVLNGWDMKLKPTLKPEAVQHREISEISQTLKDLAAAGAPLMPDDPAQNVVRSLLGLPEIDLEALEVDSMLSPSKPLRPDADLLVEDEQAGDVPEGIEVEDEGQDE